MHFTVHTEIPRSKLRGASMSPGPSLYDIPPAGKYIKNVMPDLIRHPVLCWITTLVGMTNKA
jgi:hypothetical protein